MIVFIEALHFVKQKIDVHWFQRIQHSFLILLEQIRVETKFNCCDDFFWWKLVLFRDNEFIKGINVSSICPIAATFAGYSDVVFLANASLKARYVFVTAHPLPKGSLWVKYGPVWAKGKEDMLQTRDLGRTEKRTHWSL